jgi:hypothetical protein
LHLAAGSGCLEMVQLLVENGANIDVATTGGQTQTPWHFMPPGSVVNGSPAVHLERDPGLGRRAAEMQGHLVEIRNRARALAGNFLEVKRLFGKEPACMLPFFFGQMALRICIWQFFAVSWT